MNWVSKLDPAVALVLDADCTATGFFRLYRQTVSSIPPAENWHINHPNWLSDSNLITGTISQLPMQ